MEAGRQLKFYKLVGEELTKTREGMNISLYDLARKVEEQWNTLRKIEAGGKFMAHQYVWLKAIGVDFDLVISRLDEPEILVVEERVGRKTKYSHLLEESDEESDEEYSKKSAPEEESLY